MSPEKLIVIASSISLEIIKGKTTDEISEIRNLLSLIASNLSTYCQQKIIYDKNNSNNNN
ncbi:MAG: hypothetical protein J6T74_05690 [Clostridia bacterium]|nr:hypothetical protein [Clostridia bacterium]